MNSTGEHDNLLLLCLRWRQDLDVIVRTVLQKAGESNSFIREDVDRSLQQMVEHCAPQRAMAALITGGNE